MGTAILKSCKFLKELCNINYIIPQYLCTIGMRLLDNQLNSKNMSKSIKSILIIVGVILIGYGIYTIVVPETILSIGSLDVKAKDTNNNNSYIMIGLGIAALLFSFIGGRKS